MENQTPLSHYQIFNKVAETGNISLAAKELFISQPAISKSIKKLEEELNVLLFSRSSRGVRLTEEGKLLYEYTREAFQALNAGEAALRQFSRLGVGHVRIGVSTTLCKYLLLPFLKEFVADHLISVLPSSASPLSRQWNFSGKDGLISVWSGRQKTCTA